MPTDMQVRINTPCGEHWGQMTPDNQGRFCGSCKKIVVDFTMMDDREIVEWFGRRQGSTCGRFREDQLARDLIAAQEKRKGGWRYWNYLIAGLLFSSEISAQGKPASAATFQLSPAGQESRPLLGDTVAVPAKKPVSGVIRGRVMDSEGQPVTFATIMFSTKKGVTTDGEGFYSFNADYLQNNPKLTVSAVGYQTLQIDANSLRRDGSINMARMEGLVSGEVVVVVHRRKKNKPVTDTLAAIRDSLSLPWISNKGLRVYPNPVVKGTSITLSARLDQPGMYRVELFSASGSVLETVEIDGAGKSGSMMLNIPAALVPGTYFISLSHPAWKKTLTQQIVVL